MAATQTTRKRLLNKAKVLEILDKRRGDIQQFDVKAIGLFGSLAKGKARPTSDIDILVEFNRPTFDKYMDLKFFLEDLFGRKVDLVLKDALKPRLKKYVLGEVIYAQGF